MRGPMAVLGVAVALGACAGEKTPEATVPEPAAPQVVEIATSDFAFTAPDTIQAGPVTFRMLAGGQVFHHAQLMRLDAGHTFADFVAVMGAPEASVPAWAHFVGGPNGADPGASAETTMHLTPGAYALICVIPGPDGKPHLALGMGRSLTVVGPEVAMVRPTADATLSMLEGSFQLTGDVTVGRRAILVENTVDAPHEAILIRLNEGATASDVTQWLLDGMQGPPPASGVGGTTGLARGEWNVIHADFTPGNYAVVDFFPNPADGRPNAAHGMVIEFRVE